jgi:excisionase family DNA binding protein
MKKQFLDIEGVSDYLSISKSQIYKKVAKKEIPFHKVGKRTLFDVDEIIMWVRCDGSLATGDKLSFMDLKSFLD